MMNLWIQHLEIKNGRTKIADQKLNLNRNLGEIQYMEASSWHYWLLLIIVHNSEIPNDRSNMAD